MAELASEAKTRNIKAIKAVNIDQVVLETSHCGCPSPRNVQGHPQVYGGIYPVHRARAVYGMVDTRR